MAGLCSWLVCAHGWFETSVTAIVEWQGGIFQLMAVCESPAASTMTTVIQRGAFPDLGDWEVFRAEEICRT
ncbi:hypothetical protein [Endozoicomonas numazuensis]|uniref:Uncharacterized protein n=1 Tax=Endozoicomonas numazuensis TaxID=1137799 RepID=A0A081NJX3_9GAMM|nr:hypothetical protein [Endozoicomonas numazuensis]KEQ18746.1 hypothetical protein GZ78_01210 [Endozoicomonas numazuensis]